MGMFLYTKQLYGIMLQRHQAPKQEDIPLNAEWEGVAGAK